MQEVSSLQTNGSGDLGSMLAADSASGLDLARCLPQLGLMSEQLVQTSAQIEDSIVEVCRSFQDIAARASAAGQRVTGILGRDEGASSGARSFEGLLQACAAIMVRLLDASAASRQVARRAVERIEEMQVAARKIGGALGLLETIARANKILALNARIEASHADIHGAGFAAVARELSLQTDRSREVTAHLGELAEQLKALANSTVADLQNMQTEDDKRSRRSRVEVEETLVEMRVAHAHMEQMLHAMTDDGRSLATDIGAAVRGLQFQDRVSQRIAHVVEDLAVVRKRMTSHFGETMNFPIGADEGFSGQSMREERELCGVGGEESAAGDVELF